MLFASREELNALHQQNERLRDELATFQEMEPHLILAGNIRDQIIELLGDGENLDAREIGELAYQMVLKREADKARDEVVTRFEQEHRRSLYERLLGEMATKEGAQISDEVQKRVETDPTIALELRDSARAELTARAKDVVRNKITAEQAAIIDKEAERQVELDRLDVKLALDRELDLASDDVMDQVKPGDKVELFFEPTKNRRERLILTWTKDVNNRQGWVYTECSERLLNQHGHIQEIPTDRFVRIGVVNTDLEKGKSVIQANKLVLGLPLVLTIGDPEVRAVKSIELKTRDPNGYHYRRDVLLTGCDFQTKDLQFTTQ